ncbi:MAG: hypothetical protein H7A45_00840 [Verrucomicrobiales bacterium]|nr:hypothetical protein [Verrucomicrobiales bacterium]
MADETPNTPAGATPPKPAESGKVQPKKETVRISLPPKPTAAPTIKIPRPAAPSPNVAAAAAPAAAPAQAPAAAPAAASPAAPARAAAAPGPVSRPAPAPRVAPAAAAAASLSPLDIGLAVAAAVLAIAAVVRVFLLV